MYLDTSRPEEKWKKYRRDERISIFLFEFSKKTKVFPEKKSSLRFYCDPSLIMIQKNILTKAISPGQYKSGNVIYPHAFFFIALLVYFLY